MPLQALMSQSERVSVGCGHRACWCIAPLRSCEIEPPGPKTGGSFQVVETHVDIALREGAVGGDNVGPRPGEKCHRHLAHSEIDVLNPCAVTAHVQRIEIVDVDVLTAVISLARPKLGARLALQDIARLNESFTEAELIVPSAAGEICIVG